MPKESTVEVLPPETPEEIAARSAALAVTTTVPGFVTCADIISKLRAKYDGKSYDVSTTSGMRDALAARTELRAARIALDKVKPEVKREALDFCAKVEADYKAIRAAVSEYEDVPDALIKAEEARKEQEKAEKARLEKLRVDGLLESLAKIRNLPSLTAGYTAEQFAILIDKVDARQIGAEFQEFQEQAETAKTETLATLKELQTAQAEREAEAARVKAEQEAEAARLEALRIEQEKAAEAERVRLAAEKAEQDRLNAIESERIAAERKELEELRAKQREIEAKAQAERDEADRKAAEERAAAQKLLDDERAELKRQQDEAARLQREKTEREAAEKAEAARVAKEKADAEAAAALKAQMDKDRVAAEKRLNKLTATHLSTLTAIMEVVQDKSISDADARAKIDVLVHAGVKRTA